MTLMYICYAIEIYKFCTPIMLYNTFARIIPNIGLYITFARIIPNTGLYITFARIIPDIGLYITFARIIPNIIHSCSLLKHPLLLVDYNS